MYNFVNFITYENGNFLEFHRPCSLRINSQNQEIKKIKGDYILFQSTFRSNFALLTIGSDFWPSKILLSNWVFSKPLQCSPHLWAASCHPDAKFYKAGCIFHTQIQAYFRSVPKLLCTSAVSTVKILFPVMSTMSKWDCFRDDDLNGHIF